MPEYLKFNVDKFTFKVATDRQYTHEGIWVKTEGERMRIGLSDYLQQHSGDVAFAEIKPAGTQIQFGEEVASIETIKTDLSFASPVTGQVVEVNPAMEDAPEMINQDPYGTGWLAILGSDDWDKDRRRLLDPQAYLERIQAEAEQESNRR